MFTYLILNLVVILVVCVGLRVWQHKPHKAWFITLLFLLILTLIFDNIIISLDIVAYNSDVILGYYIGKAPLEDFLYALLAVIIVPLLWHKQGKKSDV